MAVLEKLHLMFLTAAVLLGLLTGMIPFVAAYAGYLVAPVLLLMLYGIFLSIPVDNIRVAFRNVRFARTSIAVNFLWTPLLAWGLGAIFLADHPALWIGFLMLLVTPCTDWYLVFTGIARGNLPLSTSILPVNLVLQLLLLPAYLLVFAGVAHAFDLSALLRSTVPVLLVPFLLAHATRVLLVKLGQYALLHKRLLPFCAKGQLVCLLVAILAMFASQGVALTANAMVVATLLVPLLLFFAINYLLGHVITRWCRYSYEDAVSLHFTTLARNSPLALVIAVIAFPDQPLIALVLVIGPLIELPVLAIITHLLLRGRTAGTLGDAKRSSVFTAKE